MLTTTTQPRASHVGHSVKVTSVHGPCLGVGGAGLPGALLPHSGVYSSQPRRSCMRPLHAPPRPGGPSGGHCSSPKQLGLFCNPVTFLPCCLGFGSELRITGTNTSVSSLLCLRESSSSDRSLCVTASNPLSPAFPAALASRVLSRCLTRPSLRLVSSRSGARRGGSRGRGSLCPSRPPRFRPHPLGLALAVPRCCSCPPSSARPDYSLSKTETLPTVLCLLVATVGPFAFSVHWADFFPSRPRAATSLCCFFRVSHPLASRSRIRVFH